MTNQISEKREISFNLAILKIKQHGNLDELKDFLDKIKENYKGLARLLIEFNYEKKQYAKKRKL
jgi:hypothetical protein